MRHYFFLIFITIPVLVLAMDGERDRNKELVLELSDTLQGDQEVYNTAFQLNQELFFSIHDYALKGLSDLSQVEAFLEKKSDVNSRFLGNGDTPLDWAIGGVKNNCLLKLLLKRKADPRQKSSLKKDLNHFEVFLMNQNKEYPEKIISLFLNSKADPCKLIPPHTTYPYEHVIQLKRARTVLLSAMLERLFPLSDKKKVITFLLCMKTIKNPSLRETQLALNPYHVPPKGVQYLILEIVPIIKVLDLFKHVAQKSELSEYDAKELKNALLCAVHQYLNN